MRVCQVGEIMVELNFYLLTAMKNNLLKSNNNNKRANNVLSIY